MADDNFVVTAQVNDAAARDWCATQEPGTDCQVMCGDGTTVPGRCSSSGDCDPASPCDTPCFVWCRDGSRPDGCDPANCGEGTYDCVEPADGCAAYLGDADRAAHMDYVTCKCEWNCVLGGLCTAVDSNGHPVIGSLNKQCDCVPSCVAGTPCIKSCGGGVQVDGVVDAYCNCAGDCGAASSSASASSSGASDPCPECTAIGLPCGCNSSASESASASRPCGCAGDPATVARCDRLGLGHHDKDCICFCDPPPGDPCLSEDPPGADPDAAEACDRAGGVYYLASDCTWKCWTGPASGDPGASDASGSSPDSTSSAASLPADLSASSAPFPASSASGDSGASGSDASQSGSTSVSDSSQSLDSDALSRSASASAEDASRSVSQSADDASRVASEDADAAEDAASRAHEDELSADASLTDEISAALSWGALLSRDASRVASRLAWLSDRGAGADEMSEWASTGAALASAMDESLYS